VNNNIKSIEVFFNNQNKKKLILNQHNESINLFYIQIIEYYAKLKKVPTIFQDKISIQSSSSDLFEELKIYIYVSTNTKDLEKLIQSDEKVILITDYKNYKKYSSKIENINTYNFEKDLIYFFQTILKIQNESLINYSLQYPHLAFSELSKFLINESNYKNDINNISPKKDILSIRKEIFQMRKSGLDIKKFYSLIKEESHLKKLNFLVY
jgi:hypothetical protein